MFTYKADLTLMNLKLGSDANYTCVAKRHEDGADEILEEVVMVLGMCIAQRSSEAMFSHIILNIVLFHRQKRENISKFHKVRGNIN